jgi:outer membrane immunogenic protein
MRRTALTLIGAGVVALSSQVASAADMRARPAPVYKAAPIVAAPTWSGCYIGGHAGWGRADWQDNSLHGFISPITSGVVGAGDQLVFGYSGDFSDSGFVGGGQVGCDHQWGNWVVGGVADISWSSLKKDSDPFQIQPIPAPASSTPEVASMKLKYFGTARIRAGFTNGPWLFYGTGGLAWAHNTYSISGAANPGNVAFSVSDTVAHLGWAAGLGFEWMFSPNWTFGVEYLHLDFGDANYKFNGPFPNNTTTIALGAGSNVDLKADVVRGTVNFRF